MWLFSKICRMFSKTFVGNIQSAWRKRRISPWAYNAPVFIWTPRPVGEETTLTFLCSFTISIVLSLLPPSETIISAFGTSATLPRHSLMFFSSLRVGIIIEISFCAIIKWIRFIKIQYMSGFAEPRLFALFLASLPWYHRNKQIMTNKSQHLFPKKDVQYNSTL